MTGESGTHHASQEYKDTDMRIHVFGVGTGSGALCFGQQVTFHIRHRNSLRRAWSYPVPNGPEDTLILSPA